MNWLDRYFRLSDNGTDVRTEVLGGVTTFAAMAYIIVANPGILGSAFVAEAGRFPIGPTTVATVLVAVFGCLLMGLYANRPFAVAPYMGENAFLAFGLAGWITWQMRLGSVFVSGVAFLVLTLLGLRSWLAHAISPSLKHSFAVGIGLFLAFIGLFLSGIVVKHPSPDVPVRIGDFREPRVLLAVGGFAVISLLLCWRIRGALLLGMALTAITAYLLGEGKAPRAIVALPFVGDYSLAPIALHLDVRGVLEVSFLPILLTLFLMSFLDTLGTLTGVGAAGNLLDSEGNLPQVERPMFVDALACIFSSLVGTSTSGAFIESAAGVREGARTGLATVTTGLLFAASLFFLPLFEPLQTLTHVYAPALMAVGVMMMASVTKIDFEDPTEAIPAFATIVMIAFTYNIANGLTAGLILHPLFKAATGRWREVKLGAVVLAGVCLVYYVFGLPH